MLRSTPVKLFIVVAVLAVTGFAKLPLERHLAADLRGAGLLPEPIDLETREQLGQTSFAIVLGGLRTLVAAWLNLGAQNNWERQEWFELETKYRTITTLQPRVRYYWDAAAWHLAYNAYADYGDKPDIPAARRRSLQRQFLKKGAAFLEQGTRNLPDDWRMWELLASLHRDPFKERNLPAAAAAFESALECEGVPQRVKRFYLYTLVLIPDRVEDAWEVMQELWAVESNRRFPTIRSLSFVLEHRFVPENERRLLLEIYPDTVTALHDLGWHWNRRGEGFPMDGVEEALRFLLREFQIPPDSQYSPLNTEPGRFTGFPPQLLRPR